LLFDSSSTDWSFTIQWGGLFCILEEVSEYPTRFVLKPGGDTLLAPHGGHVGIGTINPGSPLHINSPVTGFGMLRLQNSNPGLNEASMAFIPGGDAGVDRYWLEGVGLWGNPGNFVLGINGPRMVMTPDGNVGIGTTSPGTYKLYVQGTAFKSEGGSTWATASDARLKDIQGTYDKGLKEVEALTPIVYSYKKDNAMNLPSDTPAVGFVAQEVQKAIPEAVTTNDKGYLMVNNDPIILAMFNAIKELKAQNDQLRQRVETLERSVAVANGLSVKEALQ